MRRILAIFAFLLLWPALALSQVVYSGRSIPSRPTVPANSIGVENSYYLDLTTGQVFGPKTLGQWPPSPITTLSTGGNVAAPNAAVQFNNSGTFGGTPSVTINPATGALILGYTSTNCGNSCLLNTFNIVNNNSGPTSELRSTQFTQTTSINQNTNPAVLTLIAQDTFDPNIYTWGNGEHNSALYGYGQMSDSIGWSLGCIVGSTCPGTLYSANGVNMFADNHAAGELQHAYSGIIHNPQALHYPGGGIDLWTGIHNDGGIPGFNASVATFLDNPAPYDYIGQGLSNPIAGVHSAVAPPVTQSINGTITGTTLCIDSLATGAGIPLGTAVTGSGVSIGTYLVDSAPMDLPSGRLCYTVNNSQSISDESLTFTTNPISFMAQNFNSAAEADYCFRVAASVVGIDGCIGERYDHTNPNGVLGPYQVFRTNSTNYEYMYGVSSGTGRGGGIYVGYNGIANISAHDLSFNLAAPSIASDKGFFNSGTTPTPTGTCPIANQLGGSTAGSFTLNGACVAGTIILSMPFTGSSVVTGYHCTINDLTTPTDSFHETVYAPGIVTFTGTGANSDLLTFGCDVF